MLNLIRHDGPAGQTPLLIAHGLFGSGRNWGVIARRLSDARPVLAVDMRNHAGSFWAESHGYDDLAADLAQVIEAQGGPMHVLGHSMGGKAAMVLALTRPELVARLIVADIAPVAYTHSQLPNITAMRAVDPATVTRRSEAEAALAAHVADPGVRAFLLQSLDVKEGRWRLNLDVIEAELPKIMGWPETGASAGLPALFLTGGFSDYVRPEHRETIKRLFPAARFARIPGANHWLHADRPREFEAAVRAWLAA